MVHLQPEREHALYSCRVLCCLCKQQFKSFPKFFFPLNCMDSSYKIADLGEFWVTKSEALRDIIPLNAVKSQKSVYLPLKTGQLQLPTCPWQLLQSAYVWQMQSLCWDLTVRSTAGGCFTPSRGGSCVCAHQLCLLYHTSSLLLLDQGPPLGCSVPRQNQQGMLLNFTRVVHTSRDFVGLKTWDLKP